MIYRELIPTAKPNSSSFPRARNCLEGVETMIIVEWHLVKPQTQAQSEKGIVLVLFESKRTRLNGTRVEPVCSNLIKRSPCYQFMQDMRLIDLRVVRDNFDWAKLGVSKHQMSVLVAMI